MTFSPPPTSPPRLVLFPGLGVDGGVFARQAALPVRVESPDWIDPLPGDTIETYARQMAERVDPSPALGPLFLGGLSFGGLVALEAARLLKPRGVRILSCGLSYRSLAPWVRVMLKGAAKTPPALLRQALRLTPLFIRVVGRPRRAERALILSLVPRVNAKVCVWGAGEILRWEWRGGPFPVPVYHLHGAIDRIVPVNRTRPDSVVQGAGHALNLTHAEVVNRLLMDWIAMTCASDEGIRS